jgi:hypothetical protein
MRRLPLDTRIHTVIAVIIRYRLLGNEPLLEPILNDFKNNLGRFLVF